jgi:cytochrome c biogenesis protein CcmG/thiol:disulfide interchange protein DsbE
MSAMHRALCRVIVLLQLAPAFALAAEAGAPAPDFSLPLLQDPARSVAHPSADGVVRYVDFWSAWCAPCRDKMHHLDAIQQQFENLEVIGINVDASVGDAYVFLAANPVDYTVAYDPEGATAARFGVEMLPAGFLIDGGGIVRAVTRGGTDNEINKLTLQLETLMRPAESRESAP